MEPITEPKGWNKSFQTACADAEIIHGREILGGPIFHADEDLTRGMVQCTEWMDDQPKGGRFFSVSPF